MATATGNIARGSDDDGTGSACGSASNWQFCIDVGGTFTDVVARDPQGKLTTHKILSSGAIRGVIEAGSTRTRIKDSRRMAEPDGLWSGYEIAFSCEAGLEKPATVVGRVVNSESQTGTLSIDWGTDTDLATDVSSVVGTAYELRSAEEAPVVAIRRLMGCGLKDAIGPVDIRLGTTRATNALLERKGANVAFVTTKGFGDILKIGNQDRPELFDLNIRKRDELYTRVVEIDERLDAIGQVLHAPDERMIRSQLEQVRRDGVEAVAICLLHAHVNPVHEELVGRIATSIGFEQVSISSQVSRLEKIVPRGDTTVADAYLGPVIRAYVASLRRSMPQARLQLMTSNGGLIDSVAATGKDTILSGPAGGVVGCAYVTGQAGFDRAIGFDMGGTSTDVSRIDAAGEDGPTSSGFEYTHETVKAGVRIMAPMLAIETVAAGGGSICLFDGQKLIVGPQSAGADPGPACYGKGGPLTITDMNVLLGRVVPEHFPFRLDRDVVARKLDQLAEEVATATESSLSPLELAEGFLRIANAKMAAAIKRISIAKGYDAREYVLSTFGGAGGQHACAIARLLGITKICLSPFAGVLSALGIGVADVKRIGERSVDRQLDATALQALQPVFDSLENELRASLLSEGAEADALADPLRTWDMCYEGQSTLLTVNVGSAEDARGKFESQHRQLYGYVHEGRGVEIRVVRVELTAGAQRESLAVAPVESTKQASSRTSPMVVSDHRRSVPVYTRSELHRGQRFAGPAIVIEETSTIVVDEGWEARVLNTGDVVLSDVEAARTREDVSTKADPVQLELFNNQFAAVAEQMGTTLRRTALSTNVKERLDFSCAIFTPSGDLVVNAPHIPVHLGGMSDCVKSLIEDVSCIGVGDVYVTNDPYRGGSHLNDVTVVTPVHDDAGEHILFFVASRAHHAEIGGTRPGPMPPDSTSLAEEGVLISAFPWIRNGVPQDDRLRELLTGSEFPSRAPDENLADIAAQVAANQTGVRDLADMISRYGIDVVHGYMDHIRTAAEHKVRASLLRLEDGRHGFEDRLDDGSRIRLSIAIKGDRAVFDFTGTSPVLAGNLNANRAIVSSAVLYCLRCLIDEDIPLNAGVLAPVEIITPECLLNPPRSADPHKCPAVVGGNVETSQRIVDCVLGALKLVGASQGTMNNVLIGNDSFGYYETICGGAGAGPGFDGADAVHTHMTNTRATDPEVLESRYPIRLVRLAIRSGSGGDGLHRGGDGVVRELEFLDRLSLSILSQRRTTVPYGMNGGEPGRCGKNVLVRAGNQERTDLAPIAHVSVERGDRLVIETPGGGGYGVKRRNVETSKC